MGRYVCENMIMEMRAETACLTQIFFSWHNFSGSFIAKTWCVLTIHSINVLYSAPLVTHTVSSCKLFIDLCSRGKKSIRLERKLCFVTCTSQYIHWLGYSRCCVRFSGRDFCRVIPSGNRASFFPKVHGAIIWIGRKKNITLFWLNSI